MNWKYVSFRTTRVYADMTPDLFDIGWGRILGARPKSGGRVEVGIILLDVHCTGVIGAAFNVMSEEELDEKRRSEIEKIGRVREIDPACARKIIEGAVAYARNLGFSPHPSFKKAMRVFGGVQASDCPDEFTFGRDGKPHFREDPNEPPETIARAILQLYRRCGWEGFDYTISPESAEAVKDLFQSLELTRPDDFAQPASEPPPEEREASADKAPPAAGMAPFYSLFDDLAFRETRSIIVPDSRGGLPPGEYAFIEFYCVDPECDCRRVMLQVWAKGHDHTVFATINYGWESEEYYTRWLNGDRSTARAMAGPSLDPLNPQSEHAEALLQVFADIVLNDSAYVERLKRHYRMFREKLSNQSSARPAKAPARKPRIPKERQDRFDEIAGLILNFARVHFDEELTRFALELWTRVCRRKDPGCMRGNPGVWAASVVHVIARMNFLFDKSQPVHTTFGTICEFFDTKKTTVGNKASQIEKALKLRQHSEPGLCRPEFVDTFTTVRLSNGMILSLKMAKEMGLVPADAFP